MEIKYETIDGRVSTPCPFKMRCNPSNNPLSNPIIKVGSFNCSMCNNYVDIDNINKTVTCNHPGEK